jgi:hypothetical protein
MSSENTDHDVIEIAEPLHMRRRGAHVKHIVEQNMKVSAITR